MMKQRLAVYISAHGFGHWSQMAPVLQHLHRQLPDLHPVLRTALPETLLHQCIDFPFTYLPGEADIGVIQRDAMREDVEATRQAVAAFHRHWHSRVEEESRLLHDYNASLVLSDIAPLAFAAATRAGIPSLGLCTLDWHDIYEPLFGADFPPLQEIAAAHESCTLLLKPPLSMPMLSFPRRKDIGLITRTSSVNPADTLARLGLAPDMRTALVAFGGVGTPEFDIHALAEVDGWRFILPDTRFRSADLPVNVLACDTRQWKLVDLLAAADCVVCKPGYGILAEAWAANKPVAYVPRPNFPEYSYLKAWLEAHAPAEVLPLQAFESGDWLPVLDRLITAPRTYPALPPDGAEEAAAIIARLL